MNIEYKIEWLGIANAACTVTVLSEEDLAIALKDLFRGEKDGYHKDIKVYFRNVDDWQILTPRHGEPFNPGDSIFYKGIAYTLMVLVFPEGVATWVAIAEDEGSEPTLLDEQELVSLLYGGKQWSNNKMSST